MFNNQLREKWHWLFTFANFHGVNNLIMVYYKLPTQYHWSWNREKTHTIDFHKLALGSSSLLQHRGLLIIFSCNWHFWAMKINYFVIIKEKLKSYLKSWDLLKKLFVMKSVFHINTSSVWLISHNFSYSINVSKLTMSLASYKNWKTYILPLDSRRLWRLRKLQQCIGLVLQFQFSNS